MADDRPESSKSGDADTLRQEELELLLTESERVIGEMEALLERARLLHHEQRQLIRQSRRGS